MFWEEREGGQVEKQGITAGERKSSGSLRSVLKKKRMRQERRGYELGNGE